MDTFTPREQQGDILQYDRPDWEPLVLVVGEDLAGWFMWMGEIELDDGTPLQAYKHQMTRHYLHLDAEGHAYWFKAGSRPGSRSRYTPIPLATAIEDVLEHWLDASDTDGESVALARAAIARAIANEPGSDA